MVASLNWSLCCAACSCSFALLRFCFINAPGGETVPAHAFSFTQRVTYQSCRRSDIAVCGSPGSRRFFGFLCCCLFSSPFSLSFLSLLQDEDRTVAGVPNQIHFALCALLVFQSKNNRLPRLHNAADAAECVALARQVRCSLFSSSFVSGSHCFHYSSSSSLSCTHSLCFCLSGIASFSLVD